MAYKGRNSHKTLCYYCAKSTISGCSWSNEFKPVEGLDAIPTRLLYITAKYKGKRKRYYSDSYDVYSCPEFVVHDLCMTNKKWGEELEKCLAFRRDKDGV